MKDSKGNIKVSRAATLTEAVEALTVEGPEDIAAKTGETAHFTVVATGEGLTYEWQFSNNGGESFVSTKTLPGYNTDTLDVYVVAARFNWQFRCIVKDSNGNTKVSRAATLLKNRIIILDEVSYFILDDDTLIVTGYSGNAETLVIPGAVDGMTVTEIGEEAFMGNESLRSIDLPDSIRAIRARAFKNCINLSNMN